MKCPVCDGTKTDPPGQPLHSANIGSGLWVPQYFNGFEVKACRACGGTGEQLNDQQQTKGEKDAS